MKTLVISDTLLLSSSYYETIETINYLNYLQENGYKIVILSNYPNDYVRNINGLVNKDKIERKHCSSIDFDKKIKVNLFDKKGNNLFKEYLDYDYLIFGNGYIGLNKNDDIIYEGDYLSINIIKILIKLFRNRGYEKFDNVNVGRFYRPIHPIKGPLENFENIYAFFCAPINKYFDKDTLEAIVREIPEINGYILNQGPCFFANDVNKLKAFEEGILPLGDVLIDDTRFILGDETENDLANKYEDITLRVGNTINKGEKTSSLKKALFKI